MSSALWHESIINHNTKNSLAVSGGIWALTYSIFCSHQRWTNRQWMPSAAKPSGQFLLFANTCHTSGPFCHIGSVSWTRSFCRYISALVTSHSPRPTYLSGDLLNLHCPPVHQMLSDFPTELHISKTSQLADAPASHFNVSQQQFSFEPAHQIFAFALLKSRAWLPATCSPVADVWPDIYYLCFDLSPV